MDGFDRIYDLHRILKGRKTAISTEDICAKMECSRATFNRVKKHMVDFLGAPIEYDRGLRGYRYAAEDHNNFELPGLWFSQQELFALLLVRDLVHSLGVGILKNEVAPVEKRINVLLANAGIDQPDFKQHFRLLGVATRKVEKDIFTAVTDAIVRQESLFIVYEKLNLSQVSKRDISPQRLINYRNNWYLDAWCHKQQDYRTFALEGIMEVKASKLGYVAVNADKLDQYYQASYGIYAGNTIEQATICFAPSVARRVSKEEWHPQQITQWNDDGSYSLSLPFNASQPQELIMDVIKYFDQAQIIEPAWLRERAKETLHKAWSQYQ